MKVKIIDIGSYNLTYNTYYDVLDAEPSTGKVLIVDDHGNRIWIESYQYTH